MSFVKRITRDMRYIGWKNVITYFFFQRILRINSHVPWPVHWASIVSSPHKIKRKYWRPYPGYMPGQYIQAMNGIEIGKNVRMGPGVKIISGNHDIYNFDIHVKSEPIVIGDNCWLSANCVLLPGSRLGNHVIVAAGAVVNRCFPDNCVVGGVPARVLKEIEQYKGRVVW